MFATRKPGILDLDVTLELSLSSFLIGMNIEEQCLSLSLVVLTISITLLHPSPDWGNATGMGKTLDSFCIGDGNFVLSDMVVVNYYDTMHGWKLFRIGCLYHYLTKLLYLD